MSEETNNSGLKDLFQAGVAVGASRPAINNSENVSGLTPFTVIPETMDVKNLKEFFPKQRIEQFVQLLEAGSFVDYVNRYKTDQTMIFADVTETSASFLAVFDYHAAAPELWPDYLAHKARLDTIQTPEFKTWLAANGKKMNQVEFATWLEDNAPLFVDPPGAVLLELVQTLAGKSDVTFNSGIRLDNGQNKLTYDEIVNMTGQAKGGEMQIPTILTANVVPFQGSAAYVIRARLKYRIDGKKLSMWFETIALPAIIRDAILGLVALIAAPQLTAEALQLAQANLSTLLASGPSPEIIKQARAEAMSGTGIIPLLGKLG